MAKCEECDREFADDVAYSQHMSDKHGVKQEKKPSEATKVSDTEGEKRYKKKRSKKKYGIIAVIIIIIAAAYFVASSPSSNISYTPILGIDNIVNFKGDENAPVVIEEYSDYQCPFCSRFARETLPQLQSEYIDTGKVKLVFKDFPLPIHDQAPEASEAALCAGDQGMYWEMHDIMFANQDALFTNNLKKFAGELGLNQEAFDACLDSGIMSVKVRENNEEGKSKGVSETPYFFVNGKVIRGAQPFSQFSFAIEAALAELDIDTEGDSEGSGLTAETVADNETISNETTDSAVNITGETVDGNETSGNDTDSNETGVNDTGTNKTGNNTAS